MSNNDGAELLQKLRSESAKKFRAALIYTALFTILWSVVGKLLPPGNWMIAFNVLMLLISIWLIYPFTFKFFRMRMDWKWLAVILTAITWFAVVVGIRTLIFNVFY